MFLNADDVHAAARLATVSALLDGGADVAERSVLAICSRVHDVGVVTRCSWAYAQVNDVAPPIVLVASVGVDDVDAVVRMGLAACALTNDFVARWVLVAYVRVNDVATCMGLAVSALINDVAARWVLTACALMNDFVARRVASTATVPRHCCCCHQGRCLSQCSQRNPSLCRYQNS